MDSRISYIKKYVKTFGALIERNHGISREILSYSFKASAEGFNKFRKKEYKQYYEMIKGQIPIVTTEYVRNIFSRRLLFQFNRLYYENKKEDYLICPESFIAFFVSDDEYELLINIRSSDVNRLEEDISIIKEMSMKIFSGKRIKIIKVHICNIHCYE